MDPSAKTYVRNDDKVVINTSPFVTMLSRDVVRALLVGAVAGLVTAGVFYLLNVFIFGAVLCRGTADGCAQAPLYSSIIAIVVGAIAGIVGLTRVGVYRPLLVVVASTISLWGLHDYLANTTWYVGLIALGLLFACAYLLFSWIARIRSFIVSAIVMVVLIVVTRLVIGA